MMKPNQFDMPIITPLLACYSNIPAPIIYPPGVDPYSFMIKKPHRDHQMMEIACPMDIDPCVVVSRTQCVGKAYDLTASEHAGVSLSDALPMVSTISNSPAHSTTQPIVKDVVVTDIQGETGSFIYCEPCKITCTSEDAYKRHIERKTHLKNCQMLLVVSSTSNSPAHSEVSAQPSDVLATDIQTEGTPSIVCDGHKEGTTHLKNAQGLVFSSEPKQQTESPIANDTLGQHPDNKKNQDPLLKEALAVEDSLFVCSIPDVGCDYQRIVTEDQMTIPMCMDQMPMTKTNGGAQLLWCKICKISCSSEQCLERHMLGKPHLKALKLSEQIQASQTSTDMTPIETPLEDSKPIEYVTVNMDGSNTSTWCEVCKISCTSEKDINRHFNGKKHIKNVKNLQNPGKVPELPSTPSSLMNMTSVNLKEGNLTPSLLVNMTNGVVVNPKEGISTQCELCGVSCTSREELNKHLAGQKHKKIVRNSETLKRHSLAPVAAQEPLEDLMYEDMEEGQIVTVDRNKRKDNGSLASDGNVNIKRQKVMEEGQIVTVDRNKRKDNGSLASDGNVDIKRQKVMEKEMDSGELLTCRLCNVASNGVMAYQYHLRSSEHSAMVMKRINGVSSKK